MRCCIYIPPSSPVALRRFGDGKLLVWVRLLLLLLLLLCLSPQCCLNAVAGVMVMVNVAGGRWQVAGGRWQVAGHEWQGWCDKLLLERRWVKVAITMTGFPGMSMDTLGGCGGLWLAVVLNVMQTVFLCWARPPTQGVRNPQGSPQPVTHGFPEAEASS